MLRAPFAASRKRPQFSLNRCSWAELNIRETEIAASRRRLRVFRVTHFADSPQRATVPSLALVGEDPVIIFLLGDHDAPGIVAFVWVNL